MSDTPIAAPAAQPVVDPKAQPIQGQKPGTTGSVATPTQPAESNPVKDAAQEAIRKHKVKYEGKEIEVDEEELKRGYSHQKHASKILQEGKAARKQAEEFVSMMKDKSKLFDAIQKLGHDPRKLAEEYLASQLQDEMMDPRDKELRDTKAKLQKIEDMERMQREAAQKRHNDEVSAQLSKEYSTQFVSALQESGLPPTKPMVADMAKYISRSAKIGFKMTPQEAAKLVKQDVEKAHMALLGNSDGETLLKLLGDEVASKILTARGSKLKSPEAQLRTPAEQGEHKERGTPNKRMSSKEWRNFNRKK